MILFVLLLMNAGVFFLIGAYDSERMKIPKRLILAYTLISACVLAASLPQDLCARLWVSGWIGLFLLFFERAGMIGSADRKLIMISCVRFGFWGVTAAMEIALVLTLVRLAADVLRRKKRLSNFFPFGPLLCFGFWCVMVFSA